MFRAMLLISIPLLFHFGSSVSAYNRHCDHERSEWEAIQVYVNKGFWIATPPTGARDDGSW